MTLAAALAHAGPYDGLIAKGLATVGASLTSEHIRLRDFFSAAWPVVNPGIPYVPNWHNDLIAEHLEAVHLGQIHLLDVEMPPRMGKSYHVTVAFPAWEWTEDPTERYLFSSYSQKLCNRHSIDRRAVIRSNWYQNRWGKFIHLADDQNLKTEFQNTARGHMITAPFGSSGTGSGGRRLVIDDPINPKQASSKIQRESAYDYYRQTLTTRLDDETNSAIIIVAQRTDKEDLTGRVVSEKDGWVRLKIPIEAKSKTTYIFPISGITKVYEVGELLCPARKSKTGVAALRRAMGPRAAAAQLDQEPSEQEGILFRRSTWVPLAEEPVPLFVLNVWDTAVKEKKENDPSAGLCIVKHAKGYHFCRGITHGHLRFGELKLAVKAKYAVDMPNAVLVEDKSSGQQLIQEMQDENDMPVVAPDPDFQKLDKFARASLVSPLWEAGRVSYDPNMAGVLEMIEEFAAFPNAAHDDRVDAGVHGVRYLQMMDREAPPEEAGETEDRPIDEDLQ